VGKLWRQHTCLSNTAVHFSVLWVVLVVHFHRTLTQVNLTAACNVDCHCMSDMFEPVCGADNLIYFSPCYAGCHNTSADRKVLDSSQTLLFFPVISQFSFVFFQYLQIQWILVVFIMTHVAVIMSNLKMQITGSSVLLRRTLVFSP